MDNIKYHLEKLNESLAAERKANEAEIARLKNLASIPTMVSSFEKVPCFNLRYSVLFRNFGGEQLVITCDSSSILATKVLEVSLDKEGVEKAKALIEEYYTRDMPIHQQNMEKHKANEAAIEKVIAYVKLAGVPENVLEYNSRKRRKESVRNPVFHALYESMPRYQHASYNFEYAKRELITAIERKLEEAQRVKAEKESQARAARLSDPLLPEAVEFLALRGKKAGTDYELSSAVEVANEISFEEEVNRLRESCEMHPFSGEDSCENCGGWDGVSNRCECGNRRVAWTTGYGHSFKSPYVVAEAH